MNERDKLIAQLIKEKGGTKEQYVQLLDSIAYHESAGSLDPKQKQWGGGPGRGVYQFETGKNEGGITAARRTKQYYQDLGIAIPAWLEDANKLDSLDASTLNRDQQDVLFLGNMRKHPKANFADVWNGNQSIAEFWANYHWAGAAKDRKKRLESFNESYNRYNGNNTNISDTYPATDAPPQVDATLAGRPQEIPQPVKPEKPRVGLHQFMETERMKYGGLINGNCGGPGQPPCPDKEISLDDVDLGLIVRSKNDPRYKAYKDSLNLHNKGLNSIKEGDAYNYMVERGYRNAEEDKKMYGKRDYDFYKKGAARENVNIRENSFGYIDGLHVFEDDYIPSDWSEPLVPLNNPIQPYRVLWGPESEAIPLYKKPTQPVTVVPEKPINEITPAGYKNISIDIPLVDIDTPKRKKGYNISDLDRENVMSREAHRREYTRPNNIPYNIKLSELTKEQRKALLKNRYAYGGLAPNYTFADKEVNHYGEGGLHETNPYGGIPLGQGNTVEEGEVSYNFKHGKFIFSNRINYEK